MLSAIAAQCGEADVSADIAGANHGYVDAILFLFRAKDLKKTMQCELGCGVAGAERHAKLAGNA